MCALTSTTRRLERSLPVVVGKAHGHHKSKALCVEGGAPTPLVHRCSKFHIKIMGDGGRAYMA